MASVFSGNKSPIPALAAGELMLVVLLGIYSGSQSYIQAQSHTAAGFQLFFHSSGLVSFIFYFALFLIKNQQIKYWIIKMYKYTNQLQQPKKEGKKRKKKRLLRTKARSIATFFVPFQISSLLNYD